MFRNFVIGLDANSVGSGRGTNLARLCVCIYFHSLPCVACSSSAFLRWRVTECRRPSGSHCLSRWRVIWIIFVSFRLILYTICATVVSFSRLVVFTTPAGKHKSVLFCRFWGLLLLSCSAAICSLSLAPGPSECAHVGEYQPTNPNPLSSMHARFGNLHFRERERCRGSIISKFHSGKLFFYCPSSN